jgi:hypothetical protein
VSRHGRTDPAAGAGRRRGAIAIGFVAGLMGGAAVIAGAAEQEGPAPPPPAPRGTLTEPARSALDVPAPHGLADGAGVTTWTHVRRAVVARAHPRRGAAKVARVARRTPEGTVTALPVDGRRHGRDGRVWLRVTLPVLPNGTRAWVPRRAVGGYEISRHRLVVDRARLRLTLYARGRVVLRAPVGIGQDRWPTPRGTFLVRNRLAGYTSRAYGPVAFGTSGRSATLTDWPAGGFIGIHGTDRPGLIPGRVSHGCIRLRNSDMLELARRMPVGTTVEIR